MRGGFLDVPQGNTSVKGSGDERMPQRRRGHVFVDAGGFGEPAGGRGGCGARRAGGDVAGFEAAVAETDAALAAEEVLNDRFNSEFADEFSAVEDPDAPAANERGSDAGAAD